MKLTTIVILALGLLLISCEETADTTAPDISITSPINGVTIEDTVLIKVLVTDDTEVASVEFFVDGDLIATDTEEPFEESWITNGYANDQHSIQCKAIDEAGNEALSDNIVVTVDNVLFALTLTGDWLEPGTEGVFFISDLDGENLFDESWTGNTTIEVIPTSALPTLPERIAVTTVKSADWDENRVLLNTNYHVIPAQWTFQNAYKYVEGEAILNFINIPNHTSYWMNPHYDWGRRGGILPNTVTVNMHENLGSVFIQMRDENNGAVYKWIDGVEVGQTYDIDLSNMETSTSTSINFAGIIGVGYQIRVQGLLSRESWSDYYFDSLGDNNNLPDAAIVYYPTTRISEYRTRITIYETSDQTNYWQHDYIGAVPSVPVIPNIDFEYVTIAPSYVRIAPTGTFSHVRCDWEYIDSDDIIYQWRVNGIADDYSITLPQLPQSFLDKYPGISRNDFTLLGVRLIVHDVFESQDEVIEQTFVAGEYYSNLSSEQYSYQKGNPEL